jgi:polyhydroxyalkanoate synthase
MSFEPENLRRWLDVVGQTSQKLAGDVIGSGGKPKVPEIFRSLTASLAVDTERWLETQNRYYQKYLELWGGLLAGGSGGDTEPVAVPDKGDRRFHAQEWKEHPYFDYLKQCYLLNSQWLMEIVENAALEPTHKNKLKFFTRQYLDAMAPTNFPITNPEAIKLALSTEGESLRRGLQLLLEDLEKGRVSMTDESAFEVGRNLAITPGAVVFRNEFFELIQYAPSTEKVYERPLLIVPPCINKYYILDMQPENSFVRYCVEQGHSVFIISWRNIPPEMGASSWDDYLSQGIIKALDVTLEIGRVKKLNILGFCVGGTMLASALAVMPEVDRRACASLTLLATMLDFSDTGEISVYVDEAYVRTREKDFANGGLMHGSELALTFASLRANELIWFYVVNNYLKGKRPDAFDLLYWNSDGANLPGTMYAYYVRNMYLENSLKIPGKLTMLGTPVDLSIIDMPTFLLATREDHIVPWRSAYATVRLLSSKIDFVLAASGHIAGVINPASKNRRNYWVGNVAGRDADQWLAGAQSLPGSWWLHWSDWLRPKAGKQIDARARLGSDQFPALEPAPGTYVKVRSR